MRLVDPEASFDEGHYEDSCLPSSQSDFGEQSLSGVSLAAFRAVTAHLQTAEDQELNAVFSLFTRHGLEGTAALSTRSAGGSPAVAPGRSLASAKVPSPCVSQEPATKFNLHRIEPSDYCSITTTTSASDAFRPGRVSTSSSWSSTSPFAAATFSFLDGTAAGAQTSGGCSSTDSSPSNAASVTPSPPLLALPKTVSRVTRAESPVKVPSRADERDSLKPVEDATSAARRRLKTPRKPPRTTRRRESQDTTKESVLQRALRTPVRCSPRLQRSASPKNSDSTPSHRCPQGSSGSCKDASRSASKSKSRSGKDSSLNCSEKDGAGQKSERTADTLPSLSGGKGVQGTPVRMASPDNVEGNIVTKTNRVVSGEKAESRKSRLTKNKPSRKRVSVQAPDQMAGHTCQVSPVSSARSPRRLKRERPVCEEPQEDVRLKRKQVASRGTASYEKDSQGWAVATQGGGSGREARADPREETGRLWVKADHAPDAAGAPVTPACPSSCAAGVRRGGLAIASKEDVFGERALPASEEPGKTLNKGDNASPCRCEGRDDGAACPRLKWDYGISDEKRRISSTASTVSSVPVSKSFTSLIVSDPPTSAEDGSGVFCSPSISADETPARPVFFRHKVLRPTPEITSPPEFDLGLFLVRTAAVSKHVDDIAPLLEDSELMAGSKVYEKYVSCSVDGPHRSAFERLLSTKVLADIPKVRDEYRVGEDMQTASWYRPAAPGDGQETKERCMEDLLETQDSWNPFSIFGSSLPCVELEDVFDHKVYKTTAPSARVSHPLFRRLAQFFEFTDLWKTVTRAEWERVRSSFKTHWKKQYKLDLDWRNDPVTVDEFMWMLEANGQKEDKTASVFEAEVCFCVTPNPAENFAWNDPRCHRYQNPRPSMSHHILDQISEQENISLNVSESPELGGRHHRRAVSQCGARTRSGCHSSTFSNPSAGARRLSVSSEYDPCLVTSCATGSWQLPALQARLPVPAER